MSFSRSSFRRALLVLVCVLLFAACQRTRTLNTFEPALNRTLTAQTAEARFGPPDEVTGSGLLIYVYHLADGQQLWLGFPGAEPIIYAKLRATDGTSTDLVLR